MRQVITQDIARFTALVNVIAIKPASVHLEMRKQD
jgi:hypothetical protein